MKKKKNRFILLALVVILVTLLAASTASATGCDGCGSYINTSVGSCLDNGKRPVTISGNFSDSSWWYSYKHEVWVGSTLVGSGSGKSFSAMVELGAGSYTATAVLYKKSIFGGGWNPANSISKTFSVAGCHNYTMQLQISNNCTRHKVVAKLYDNGVYTGNSQVLVYENWLNPYTTESAGPYVGNVTFSPGGTFAYNSGVINEPERCLVVIDHWYEVEITNDCFNEGWSVAINTEAVVVADGPTEGIWALPYDLEIGPMITFTLTWLDGYSEEVMVQVEEEEECVAEFLKCKTLDAQIFLVDNVPYYWFIVTNSCEYYRWNTPTMSPRIADFWYNDNINEKWVKWEGRWAKLVGVTPPHPLDSSVIWDGLPQDASGKGSVTTFYDPRPFQKALE